MINSLDTKYPDKEKFKVLIAQYFSNCQIAIPKLPLTLPGLAEHLKCMTSDIINYPKSGPLSNAIGFASLKCENFLINGLITGEINKSVGDVLLKLYFSSSKKEVDDQPSIGDILNDLE